MEVTAYDFSFELDWKLIRLISKHGNGRGTSYRVL